LLAQATGQLVGLRLASGLQDESSIAQSTAQLKETMLQIILEVSFVTPEQVELVNPIPVNETVENTELNVTLIDEAATQTIADTGTLSAMFIFGELTEQNIEWVTSKMLDQLASIKDEITFSVPIDEVEIIGNPTPIEELRASLQ
jgi:hypothetical protein